MKRNEFIKKDFIGLGGVVTLSGITVSNAKKDIRTTNTSAVCKTSPKETKGPFPNKAPSEYAQTSIVDDRKGIPLSIVLRVLSQNKDCEPCANTWVDIWHGDATGLYSEYNGFRLQSSDLKNEHFLRGRQSTDAEGRVKLQSIFPGYYRGRVPHIPGEILSQDENSRFGTQIAFPKAICDAVYASEHYRGSDYMSNEYDLVFRDSLERSIAASVEGIIEKELTLHKTIVVP